LIFLLRLCWEKRNRITRRINFFILLETLKELLVAGFDTGAAQLSLYFGLMIWYFIPPSVRDQLKGLFEINSVKTRLALLMNNSRISSLWI
jgi:hypothetical protein